LDNLSNSQKNLLRKGLLAHYREPADIACRSPDPGCFELKSAMAEIEDRKERATRRADQGRSIARLIKRGLVESCSRGKWRLPRAGFEIARELHPGVKPSSKRELAGQIAMRKAVQAWEAENPERRRRRRSKAAAKVSAVAKNRVADFQAAWVEVSFDY
jgi:restriction endonuclease Mrr